LGGKVPTVNFSSKECKIMMEIDQYLLKHGYLLKNSVEHCNLIQGFSSLIVDEDDGNSAKCIFDTNDRVNFDLSQTIGTQHVVMTEARHKTKLK